MRATELAEIMERVFLLIQTQKEIAMLEVRHQNAPKYLHNQAQGLQEGIMFKLRLLAEEEAGEV